MMVNASHLALLLVGAIACGSSASFPADGPLPSDARQPDASSRPPSDAMPPPDGPVIDVDLDGHPAAADCNDNDRTVWQDLAYHFRDGDGDGFTVASAGTICAGASLPPGYLRTAGLPDCDDANPALGTSVSGFLDDDGDGRGAGPLVTFCAASLPPGYATVGDDCAPSDGARSSLRAYNFRDVDLDGWVIAEAGTVCSGPALPPGYLETAPTGRAPDCDDGNAEVAIALTVFVDADHDGVGAGTSQQACTSGTPPPGFASTGTDCDDADPTLSIALLFTAVDFDEDGFTMPSIGMRCTAGTLEPPYFATPHGNDCNDADAAHWLTLAYLGIDEDDDGATVAASGTRCTDGALPPPFRAIANGNDCDDHDAAVLRFAVLYPDQDGDGVGASPRQVLCLDTSDPAGLVSRGYDEDDSDPAVIESDELAELLDIVL